VGKGKWEGILLICFLPIQWALYCRGKGEEEEGASLNFLDMNLRGERTSFSLA